MGYLVFIGCVIIFIIQIVLLIKCIKKNKKEYWISLICLEIISILALDWIDYYYRILAPSGGFMSNFGEELTCFGAIILYIFMFCITCIAGIIVFEKNQDNKGNRLKDTLKLIIAFIIIMVGIVFLVNELKENFKIVETYGTIVDFKEIKGGNGSEYWPIVQFEVDGKEHKDSYPISNVKVGDKLKIYYYPKYNYRITTHRTNNKIIWIPAFIVGTLLIFNRFKKKNISK